MANRLRDQGTALLSVLLTLAMLMALAATAAVSVNKDTQLRGAFGRGVTGLYAAEAGLNKGMGGFRNIFLNFNVPSGDDFAGRSFTLGKRTVSYRLTETPGNPIVLTIPSGELFGGLNAQQYRYTVTSAASIGDDVEAEVGAEFNVGYVPLFQFVAFYANDLEILPGPEMRLHGRVHTNADLYLDGGTHLYIEDNPAQGITTVQVSARGSIHRGRKNVSQCAGRVTIDKLEDLVSPTPDLDPLNLPCNGGVTRVVSEAELAAFKGSLISGIDSISVPEPDIIEVGSGEFWQKADLRIVLRLDQAGQLPGDPSDPFPVLPHSIEVQDQAGNPDAALTATLHQFMTDAAYNAAFGSFPGTMPIFFTDVPNGAPGCTCIAAPANCNSNRNECYSPPFDSPQGDNRIYSSDMKVDGLFDGDYRRGGYYNWRERKWMYLLNINLHDLIDWNTRNGEPFFPADDNSEGGLVIFASVRGPDSAGTNNYGVRIFGSADLPIPYDAADPTGLTFASDQAAYVLGGYNTGANLPKQPAAIIGDSLNVMSSAYWRTDCTGNCNFNDRQSVRNLSDSDRRAAATTINAAFLAGVDTTAPGSYNGGLENYPRFHENWSGFTFRYHGSFVSLGTPRRVNGAWCGTGGSTTTGCNIYNPPTRIWDYDPDFNQAAKLPPLTPRFVYVQQILFTENFK
jgi:hypothetical protein